MVLCQCNVKDRPVYGYTYVILGVVPFWGKLLITSLVLFKKMYSCTSTRLDVILKWLMFYQLKCSLLRLLKKKKKDN